MKNTKILLISVLLLGCILHVHAQSKGQIAINLREKSQNGRFAIYNDLLQTTNSFNASRITSEVANATIFDLNKARALEIIEQSPALISIEINNEFTVDLYKEADAFSALSISTSSGKAFDFKSLKAAFYRGVVRGKENSLVSLSIFENEVAGFISYEEGNLVLGKLKNDPQIILYNDKDLKKQFEFFCATPDVPLTNAEIENYKNVFEKSLTLKCVRLYFETAYDIFQFQNMGSVSNVVVYVTHLYNQVATLYANDGIKTAISHIKVWDTQDPYIPNFMGLYIVPLLAEFQAQTTSINGDLGQLLTQKSSGGLAATTNGICNGNIDNSLSVAAITINDLANVPTYSWTAYVSTHEFGHLMGSKHTHACVWNGNGTAIDGCGPTYNSGYQEGNCTVGPIPQNGGTIMSYCHLLSVGVNFSYGFGPQPTAVITNIVNGGTCLTSCIPCPANLLVFTNVAAPDVDYRQANNIITAINTISNGATGVYHAGSQLAFTNGFHAVAGSDFRAYIDGCSDKFYARQIVPYESPDETSSYNHERRDLILSPNPNNGTFSLNLKEPATGTIQIFDLRGTLIYKMEFRKKAMFEINIQDKPNGIYIVKVFTDKSNLNGKIGYFVKSGQ